MIQFWSYGIGASRGGAITARRVPELERGAGADSVRDGRISSANESSSAEATRAIIVIELVVPGEFTNASREIDIASVTIAR